MMHGRAVSDPGGPGASRLSAEEIARATEIAHRFDPHPCHAILHFGAAHQKRMADLAAAILAQVRLPNAAPAGDVPSAGTAPIIEDLKRVRQALLVNIVQFKMFYEESVANLRDTLVYIHASEITLGELRAEIGASARYAADESSLAAVQVVRTRADLVSALERRRHDLKLTAMVALQAALQARLVRSNGGALIETIQSSIRYAQAWSVPAGL